MAPSDAFFLSFSEKWSISDKKVAKSLAVSRILLTFAVGVGADGKERLRWRLKWMSVLNVSLEIEMWKFQNSTMTNCNTAHAMGLLYPFLYKRKVSIYLLAWAIVSASWKVFPQPLFRRQNNGPTPFHINLVTNATSGTKLRIEVCLWCWKKILCQDTIQTIWMIVIE